jgi:hypothetical protein
MYWLHKRATQDSIDFINNLFTFNRRAGKLSLEALKA